MCDEQLQLCDTEPYGGAGVAAAQVGTHVNQNHPHGGTLLVAHFIRGVSLVKCHTSHVARHTSHVTRHTSYVTRHTSHVIRHTSHVTRYNRVTALTAQSLTLLETYCAGDVCRASSDV